VSGQSRTQPPRPSLLEVYKDYCDTTGSLVGHVPVVGVDRPLLDGIGIRNVGERFGAVGEEGQAVLHPRIV
jgi:hypothetical protein